jgi:hypothetical protein
MAIQPSNVSNSLPPFAVDVQIRQAILCCWMVLPVEKRTIPLLKTEFQRLVDRALEEIGQDSNAFGLHDSGDIQ